MSMAMAGIGAAVFQLITGVLADDYEEDARLRQERKARQRRRKDFPVVDMTSTRWEMIEEGTGRHFWL